jgi:hypothetical protein
MVPGTCTMVLVALCAGSAVSAMSAKSAVAALVAAARHAGHIATTTADAALAASLKALDDSTKLHDAEVALWLASPKYVNTLILFLCKQLQPWSPPAEVTALEPRTSTTVQATAREQNTSVTLHNTCTYVRTYVRYTYIHVYLPFSEWTDDGVA